MNDLNRLYLEVLMNDGMMSLILSFLVVLAFFIVALLIFREFVMWYWKVNKRIELAERNSRLLEKIYEEIISKKIDKDDNSIDKELYSRKKYLTKLI
jgi:hypothetical protein